jgi:hypothetical protein
VKHQTAAQKEAQILYISKKGFSNTGNVKEKRTVTKPRKV